MIKISIIMPSLNVADYIEECLLSVINQKETNIEIICVDANSTDGTADILQKIAQKDSRIRVLNSSVRSYGKQVNMGIESARGTYVAILETDDFVEKSMYGNLYQLASEHQLDALFADFDTFYLDENKEKIFTRCSTNALYPKRYNRVFNANALKSNYNASPFIWRGIYKRSFLQKQHIRFNETLGAAYQDICFLNRVMMKANAVMYIKDSYYRYRIDREASSINSVRGLEYAYQEFHTLFEQKEIEAGFEPAVMQLMAFAFIGEITQIFPRMKADWTTENMPYYLWFQEKINEAIENNILTQSMFEQGNWNRLQLLLTSLFSYFESLNFPGNTKELIAQTKGHPVVIFGAGKWGEEVLFSIKGEVEVVAFCDNQKSIWNTKRKEKDVLSIEECVKRYPKANYIIAIKNEPKQILLQLQKLGISDNQLFFYTNNI